MDIKIDGVALPVTPSSLEITIMDLDNGDSTKRSANGTLVRDRIAVKRQIKIEWPMLNWPQMSAVMTMLKGVFFNVYYPDPETGQYETKAFYCGNRPATIPFEKAGNIYWNGLSVTLTER